MTPVAGPVRWKVGEEAKLSWRFWDGEYLVFDATSGDTHLLNEVAGESLRCLERCAADHLGLTRTVAAQLGLEPDEVLAQHLKWLLVRFEELGLIEPVQP